MANNRNFTDAENLLHYFFEIIKLTGSNDASLEKIVLVVHVLEVLENNNELGRFSPALRAGLEKKLQPFNLTAEDILSFDHLCR
jgi:hypothetical protein